MDKIDLKKYYIEEHIFESFSENSSFLISLAISLLSDRLTDLASSGYKKGEKYIHDYRKEFIPDMVFGEPSPTDYHFIIILDRKLPLKIKDNGKTKLALMRLLNNPDFILDINWDHSRLVRLKQAANEPKTKKQIDWILNEFVYCDDIPQLQKDVQKHLKRNELPMIDYILEIMVIQPMIQELSKKYKIPTEQKHFLESIIEYGIDHVIQNVSNIKTGSLSYLDFYGGVVYLLKPHDERIAPQIKSVWASETNGQHLKRTESIVKYFQKKYLPITPSTPANDTDLDKHFLLFKLDRNSKFNDEKKARIIFNIPDNKPCGKAQTNKIASMRRNLKPYLK
ncbi:MAG: hypothetical protein G01um101413_481 [Parcubacteria group bacterium Gr01-1014_13]|nr:MAG: hypothetical protein G01um101413_481 [Parcubacteria group bacterium Gr01-1014_13]